MAVSTILTTLAKVKAFWGAQLDSSRDSELELAIDRAASWVAQVTNRTLEQTEYTRYFSGRDDALRNDTLILEAGHRPVKHSGSDLITVTEDGTALTVAIGYDTSVGVWLVDVNLDRPAMLMRNGSWSSGGSRVQNIVVTYKAGFEASGSSWIEVPIGIEQLVNEAAVLFFKTPNWLGQASVSRPGEQTTWEKALSPQSRALLWELRGI